VHFGITLPNAPKISDDDRFKAAQVALGNKCQSRSFYASLRAIDQHVDEHSNEFSMEIDDRGAEYGEKMEAVHAAIDENARKKCVQQWKELAASIAKQLGETTDANWTEMSKSLETFARRQKNCTNASQLTTFFNTIGGAIPKLKRAGAMIGVQPTSKARRAKGKSRGNRSLGYGRNPIALRLLNRAKKTRLSHNFKLNFMNNVNNYKKH
jgi:hypothetical protein